MIIIRLDRLLADRKISVNEISDMIDITQANVSRFKTSKIKAVKLSTMNALCKALDCQPGDIFEYAEDLED